MAEIPTVMSWLMAPGQFMQEHPYVTMGALGGLGLGVAALNKFRKGEVQGPDSHGSARWATSREVKRAGLLEPRGVVLGKLGTDYLRHDGEEHILLVGPTRSGKGVDVIIPTLLTWRGSVIVTDPKDGENYDVTAGWRSTLGPVYAFTPHRPGGVRINVLDSVLARLKTRDEFRWAYRIAQSLVSPEKMAQENHTSLHFRELAALLLTAVILHVCYTSARKSLAGVWAFMTQQHDSLHTTLKSMATTAHVSGGVHQAISSMTRAVKNITGDRELSSVWSTAIRPLVIYNDDWVAGSTDVSDFDLHDLQHGDAPVSLYLIAADPLELELLHPLYRVVLDVTLGELMGHKVRTWRHRLLNVVDEMPAYGYTRAFERGIPVKAGYGMKDLLIAQDLESLWEAYGRTTAIWGNCKVKVFFTPDNDLTAKRVSENMLGDRTVEQQVRHEGGNPAGKTSSVTYQYHARRLLTPDELMDLPADKGIARIGGIKPILFDKFDYRFEADFKPRLLPVPRGVGSTPRGEAATASGSDAAAAVPLPVPPRSVRTGNGRSRPRPPGTSPRTRSRQGPSSPDTGQGPAGSGPVHEG